MNPVELFVGVVGLEVIFGIPLILLFCAHVSSVKERSEEHKIG
ncbi:hypothetical protein PP175_28490 (plasmid) [Aneurinibacillus sp. Ricciae_BoGa-3]|nr:hypothetical protein [Aneurinibacillus sp. Ricciae_BoGa-3]WCK57130.1 hypothetical protein PP175_28490 [Aneurinibacillus sp. Ricciae_BoGa-3]